MVYDCFQFFNELDILKLRMHVLNDVVDKFVISEATVTFSGRKSRYISRKTGKCSRSLKTKSFTRLWMIRRWIRVLLCVTATRSVQ